MNQVAIPAFDDIEEYDPVPAQSSGEDWEGPGIQGEDLPTTKAALLLDTPIAVVGWLRKPNQFKKSDNDPDFVTGFEVIDNEGGHFVFWHTSMRLYGVTKERTDKGQFPFRTVLHMAQPKKKGGFPYYDFS